MAVLSFLPPANAATAPLPLYAPRDSLWETMLATRDRLQQWQKEQGEAGRAVQVGPWKSSVLGRRRKTRCRAGNATGLGGLERMPGQWFRKPSPQ